MRLRKNKKRRGAILVFVLGLTILLSYVLMQIINYALVELKSRASNAKDSSLRLDAYSALYATIAELEEYREIDGGLYSPDQGWGNWFAEGRAVLPGGSEVSVDVRDLSGKISLQGASAELLKALFDALEVPELDAQRLADAFLDWTDTDGDMRLYGAESDAYPSNAPKPPNRPIESLGEIFYIKGFAEYFLTEQGVPNDRFEKLASAVSAEKFGYVNLNTANEVTLAALLKLDGRDYDESLYEAIRGKGVILSDGITWLKTPADLENRGATPPKSGVACQMSRLKIEVKVTRGLGEYYLSVIYGTPTSSKKSSSSENGTVDGASMSQGKILRIFERASNE